MTFNYSFLGKCGNCSSFAPGYYGNLVEQINCNGTTCNITINSGDRQIKCPNSPSLAECILNPTQTFENGTEIINPTLPFIESGEVLNVLRRTTEPCSGLTDFQCLPYNNTVFTNNTSNQTCNNGMTPNYFSAATDPCASVISFSPQQTPTSQWSEDMCNFYCPSKQSQLIQVGIGSIVCDEVCDQTYYQLCATAGCPIDPLCQSGGDPTPPPTPPPGGWPPCQSDPNGWGGLVPPLLPIVYER